MRLVHLSDLHLGYRQYQRLTPTGINQREADVARTFQRAIDRIVELEPEVVLIAGDVFHTARPTNAAILHAFRQFVRLKTSLPDAIVVIVAGNHDTPRTTETGSILGLYEQLGIHVASTDAKRFSFPEHDLAVLAVPDVPGQQAEYAPDASVTHNVLVIHADVEDVVPRFQAELDRAAVRLTSRQLRASKWSYVALGHYHVHQRVAANAFYSGSTDYTSLNVWGDLFEEEELHGRTGKGFVEFDLETGKHKFHRLEASRGFVDLPPINARTMSVAEIDVAIRRVVEKHKGGIDDKVVRLVVRDVPRHIVRELDHRALREFKHRALNFNLVTRRPDALPKAGQASPGRRRSVADVVREELQRRELPPDLDRARLVELGLKYLADAEAVTLAATPLEPES